MSAEDIQTRLDEIVADTGARFTRDGVTVVVARVYTPADTEDGNVILVALPMDPDDRQYLARVYAETETVRNGLVLTRVADNGPIQIYPLGAVNDRIIQAGQASQFGPDDVGPIIETVGGVENVT